MYRSIVVAALLFISAEAFADSIEQAKDLFERYESLEKNFNPAVAELYSDTALIQNKRTYPTGQVREVKVPAPQYKEMLRKVMPIAKLRGDYSTYSNITFTAEGSGVRITADRFSVLKQYTSPISLFVMPNTGAQWLIQEELSESQP